MLAEKVNENIGATVIRMPDRKNQSYIQNEFFDAVAKTRIPGEQMQILSAIARKTWCWGKDSDLISKSQIVQATGISKTHIDRAVKALVDRNILKVTKNGNYSMQEFEINTNYDEWLPVTKKGNVTKIGNEVTKKGNKKLPNMGPTKDIKDTFTKDIIPPLIPPQGNDDSETQKVKKLSCLSKPQIEKFKSFWEAYPKHRRKEKPQAERAFKEINPDEDLFAAMMSGLEAAVKSQDWQKEGGRYVCYPERFLKKKKWLDEYEDSKGFKKAGCPMSNYMPPADLKAEADKYANTLPDNPEDWF